jgi:hypothetical protein
VNLRPAGYNAAGDHLGAQACPMEESIHDACGRNRRGTQYLAKAKARLAKLNAPQLHLSNREHLAHQRIQAHAARHQIAPAQGKISLAPTRTEEGLHLLGFDE